MRCAGLILLAAAACVSVPPFERPAVGTPSCPRAAQGSSGVCQCDAASTQVLGACLPSDVARSLDLPTVSERTCPPGALLDETGPLCAPFVFAPDPPWIDVASWLSFTVGSDGAHAPSPFCRAIASSPALFDLAPKTEATFRIDLELSIPERDVSRATATTRVESEPPGRIIGAAARAWVRGRALAWEEAFRSLGGVATVGVARVQVRCTVGYPPLAAPATKLQWLSNLP